VLLDRVPHADVASEVWGRVEDGRAVGLLAALALGWRVFEDAVTAAAAQRAKCGALIAAGC